VVQLFHEQLTDKEEMGNMKKMLVLLAVVVGIFAFSTGAFAAGTIDDITCLSCDKCTLGILACDVAGQGGSDACGYFDYDYNNGQGYGYESGRTSLSNCRAIFPICDCADTATTFVAGHTIGVRMTIMVDGAYGQKGAYWSDPADADIEFGKYTSKTLACSTAGYGSNFGPGTFWKTDATGTSTTQVNTLASGTVCAIAAGNQATLLVTNVTAGAVISADDETYKRSYWKLDVPPIRIDPNVLHNCEVISVKIELLDQSTGGICADCAAVCECIVDVAKVCCESVSGSASCLYPYFSSTAAATDEQPFWNGIVVVNTSSVAGTATLTIYQQDGVVGSFTTPTIAAHSMYVAALENIAFSGTGLGDLPVYVNVTTTFPSMDGFAIVANHWTGESMGYLCRKPLTKG